MLNLKKALSQHIKRYKSAGLKDHLELVARYFILHYFNEIIRLDENELTELTKVKTRCSFTKKVNEKLFEIVYTIIKERTDSKNNDLIEEETSFDESKLPLFSLSLKGGVERFYN